jgi:hypothetical protein
MIDLHDTSSGSGRRARLRPGTGSLFALLAGLALTTGACSLSGATGGSGPVASRTDGPTSPSPSPAQRTQTAGAQGGNSSGQQKAVQGYSADFAKCMRAHGVQTFPDPGGPGPLAAGLDPDSSTYQAALNGPCRSLAPPAWVSTGTGTPGGGS